MNELHLFAGAGGGILGGLLLGHAPVCAVEIDPYCRKVLLQRQRDGHLPRFPIWDDIKTFDARPWGGRVDVVCGGFPCQDTSLSGSGQGIAGLRSGLWVEMARVIREVGPRYVLVENSPALTLRGIDAVIGDLAEMGFAARWGVFSASDIGAAHERSRIYILADAAGFDGYQRQLWYEQVREVEIFERSREACIESIRRIWKRSKCRSAGIPYGLSDGVDRVRAAGNAQVPAVAALAWRTLTDDWLNNFGGGGGAAERAVRHANRVLKLWG